MNKVRTLLPGLLVAFMLPAMAEPLTVEMDSRWTAATLQASSLSQDPQAAAVSAYGSSIHAGPAALERNDAALWTPPSLQDDGCAGDLACGGLLGFSAAVAGGVPLHVLHASSPQQPAESDQAAADDDAARAEATARTLAATGIVVSALTVMALLWSLRRPIGKACRLDLDARRLTGRYGRRVPRIKPSATPALAPSLAPAAALPAP